MLTLKSYLGVIAALLIAFPAAAIELVMVEQEGCVYCEQWNEDIGGIYSKTTEGKFAPLRRVDIFDIPEDLNIARRVIYTPTFLIVDDGKELARLEGYPGPDFFWPLLGKLLRSNTNYDPNAGGS
jgi:thioredoxin-related protein